MSHRPIHVRANGHWDLTSPRPSMIWVPLPVSGAKLVHREMRSKKRAARKSKSARPEKGTPASQSTKSTKATQSTKSSLDPSLLQGWVAIGGFLGLPTATAQRWARTGMPVRKQGRFTVADKNELQQWLGRESHMPAPAQVVDKNTDLAAALKQSISAARRPRKK